MPRSLETLGSATMGMLRYVGGTATLTGSVARRMWRRPFEVRALARQMELSGMRSLTLTLVMALFAGMVLAFQFGQGLLRFGAKEYIGQVTSIGIVKEIVPVLVALVVGGRIAAGIAAEIASMHVTEQIDALRAVGADPIKTLAVPRVLATTLVLPLVTVAGDLVGTVGAMLIAWIQFRVGARFFLTQVLGFILIGDFLSGLIKAAAFGLLMSIIACYEGFTSAPGTTGVGRATTRAFINGAITVIISDYFLTKLIWAL